MKTLLLSGSYRIPGSQFLRGGVSFLNNNKLNLLILLFIVLFLPQRQVWGQCTNNSSFSTMAAPAAGATASSGTTSYQEYNPLTGVVAGTTYISNHLTPNNNTYITVHSGTYNGPVVAHGPAPLVWTAVVPGNHYVHYNMNAACGTSNSNNYNYAGSTGCLQVNTTCSMTWTDNGGSGGNYTDKGTFLYTFYPATAGYKVKVVFGSFSTEDRYDGMLIYNGNNTSAPLISSGRTDGLNPNTCKNGAYSGTGSPGTVISTAADGSLTFLFTCDNGATAAGWSATVSCECTTPTTYSVTGGGSCVTSGTITLSGSQTGVNYQLKKDGVNEGSVVAGTGSSLSWAGQTNGTYTVEATGTGSYCTTPVTMSGSAAITVKPAITSATGVMSVCTGGTLNLNATGEWSSLPTNATLVSGTNPNNEYYSQFNASGVFNTPVTLNNATVLVVAGGGGGGSGACNVGAPSAGGAGGLLYSTFSVTNGTSVTVGNGGATNTNGGNSVFSTLTAIGGGRGGFGDGSCNLNASLNGASGGSGGSNACYYNTVTTTGAGTPGQGNAGGTSPRYAGYTNYVTAGGGGAGAAGTAPTAAGTPGNGGIGLQYSITGTPTYYAGGGGGYAAQNNSTGSAGLGTIGQGGTAGGAGNSGTVIIRYRVPKYTLSSITATGTTINELTGVITAGSTAGTVTVTYTNEFGCSDSKVISVVPNAAITSTVTNQTCPSSNNGSISSVNIMGGLSGVRYIRIKQNLTAAQDGWLHPAELKAYEILTGTEVAQGKTATSSGVSYGGGSYPASNLVDGSTGTIYHSGSPGEAEWVEVDLGAAYNLDYIQIWSGNCCYTTRFSDLQLIFKNNAGTEIYSKKIDMSSASAQSFTYNVLDVSWSNGATTLNQSGLGAGTYTLNYADVMGCNTVAHAKTVGTTNANPTANKGTDPMTAICQNGISAVMGGSVGGSATGGTWSGGAGTWTNATNPSTATYQAGTGESGTITLTLTTSGGSCGTTSTNKTITVDAPSTLPSSITVDNNTNNCWGRPVTLTANGGSLAGASQYIYGTSSGGTQVSGATNVTSITTTPTGTATYYVGVTANGACPAQNLATGITYALPTRNALLSSNSSGTCYVSGSNPIHFYDASNNYIGSLNPQGRTGIVTMSTSVGSPAIQGACTMPSNPKYRTAYLGRIVHVDGSGLSGSGNVDVVLAYSDAELLALQVQAGNGSGGSTPGNVTDDITNLLNPSLGITKVGGDGSLCSGNSVSYLSAGGGVLSVTPSISAARYVSFAVPSFSSFYIHGVNGGSPLPITLTSFTASCEDKVSLMWKTATETNVSHYEILRSRDGQFWEEVATIPAVGNSTTEQVYHATDATGLETMYYKLRSVDNDGTSEDFQPVSVTCNPGALWSIHPVPVSVKATVTVTATETSHDVFVITDINGRVVTTQQVEIKAGTSIFELDLHRLSEGTYFIRMNQSDKYSPLKFIKVN